MYADTYAQIFDTPPPSTVTLGTSQAEIFSPGRGFMGGFDYTMQLQVGCPGGCLFCYVPAGRMLVPPAVRGPQGRRWGFEVRDKQDVAGKLRRKLAAGELAGKTIYWSGVTDPYAVQAGVTRRVWELFCDCPVELRPLRIAVQTRFRADRDAAQISEYCRSTSPPDAGPPVVVSFSIGTDRDDLIRDWERATPSFGSRLNAIRSLREADIFVVATISPCGLWNDLPGTLQQLREWGVAYLTVLFFKGHTRSANTPRWFFEYLHQHHPELLDPAWQNSRVAEMRQVFGHDRVLVGQEGFASLAAPHRVAAGG